MAELDMLKRPYRIRLISVGFLEESAIDELDASGLERDKTMSCPAQHSMVNKRPLVDVRPIEDREAMARLGREAGLEIEELGPMVAAFGVFDGDHLIGCACLKHDHGAYMIECLAVSEKYRGFGIGTRLTKAVEADAKARGAEELRALARRPAFFLKIGYRLADPREVDYPTTASCDSCPQFRVSCSPAVVIKTL